MRTKAAALGLLLSLSACMATTNGSPRDASAAGTGKPLIGRCYFGGCSWFRVDGQRVLREQGGERLVRATIAEGGSDHGPRSSPPENARGVDIGWQPATDDYHFLCSSTRPMVILGSSDGSAGHEGIRLDFVNGPYGVTEVISNQYVAVCHPGEEHDADFAARHSYRALAEGEEPEIDLATPEAVFDLPR